MSETTDTVPQRTHHVRSREVGTKAPQCAKLTLCSEAKGLPLSADSGAYAASAPKGISKAFSRKVRAKALSKANHLRSNIAKKDHSVLCSPVHQALSSRFVAELRECP